MLTVSLDTLVAVAPMLGQAQEDRSSIRDAQDPVLLERLWAEASTPMPHDAAEGHDFFVAPLDILVSRDADGAPRFQLAELNGTGIGGLTNMTLPAVRAILDAMAEIPDALPHSDDGHPPLVVIASSGRENRKAPRVNKLYYEKILYADAIARGFQMIHGESTQILGIDQIVKAGEFHPDRPTIVLGHFRDLAEATSCDRDGRLRMFDAPVSATINDRFCLNLAKRYGHRIDPDRWFTANRDYLAGADKGTAYRANNRFFDHVEPDDFPHIDTHIPFEHAETRDELVATVLRWLRDGRRPVIKPQGTGLGDGIEFFLDPHEPADAIAHRIDESLAHVDDRYDFQGSGLPYTVCPFLDIACVPDPTHPLFQHKFEIRLVVYRDGPLLRPFPSVAKVSAQRFNPQACQRGMLINNITASSQQSGAPGREFALPLTNQTTLETLGIDQDTLGELCRYGTQLVASVLADRGRPEQVCPAHALPVVQTEPEGSAALLVA